MSRKTIEFCAMDTDKYAIDFLHSDWLGFFSMAWYKCNYNPSNIFACARLVLTRHVIQYSPSKTGEYPRLLYLPTSSTKVGTIRRERLAQLLRGMFLTQTLLPTVLFGWSPPLKKQLTMPRCSVVDVVMNLNILSHHSSKTS